MLLSWCGWHVQVLCYFLLKVDMNMIWSIWSPWRNGRVPRQHIGIGNSIEIPMQKRRMRTCGTRKRWWGAPGFRVSHELVAWKRVTKRTWCRQRVHLIQHAFIRSRASSRGYTFEVRLFGTDQVRSGSRWSRHVRSGSSCPHAVVKVVVHIDGSGT